MRFATPPPQVTEQGSNSLHSDHVAQGGFPQSTISKGGPRQPVPPTQRRVRNYTEMLVKKKDRVYSLWAVKDIIYSKKLKT